MAEQTGLCLIFFGNPEDRFSRVVAQMSFVQRVSCISLVEIYRLKDLSHLFNISPVLFKGGGGVSPYRKFT